MKYYQRQKLIKELQSTGADAGELQTLLPIASKLGLLKSASDTKHENYNIWLRIAPAASFTLTGIVAGIFLVIVSQAALPTSWLYPVQKFSDSAAVVVDPSYQASVMMRRARQVNELTANGADSRAVLATLADYTQTAGAYKAMPHNNYAAFEYCKSNLEHAIATTADPRVKSAIAQSLQSLST